jgi:hypothetical protein
VVNRAGQAVPSIAVTSIVGALFVARSVGGGMSVLLLALGYVRGIAEPAARLLTSMADDGVDEV